MASSLWRKRQATSTRFSSEFYHGGSFNIHKANILKEIQSSLLSFSLPPISSGKSRRTPLEFP